MALQKGWIELDRVGGGKILIRTAEIAAIAGAGEHATDIRLRGSSAPIAVVNARDTLTPIYGTDVTDVT